MRRLASLLLTLLALGARADDGGAVRILNDVTALASDTYRGRRAGTPEADAAAAWVADGFRKAGLLPGGTAGSYLQSFEFVDGVDLGPKNALTTGSAPLGRTWASGTDFRPLVFSGAGKVTADVVFAGYGITAKELSYDDYEGLDVAGKIVLVLRYGPDEAADKGVPVHGGPASGPESPFAAFTPLRRKASTAKEKGAAALLVVTGLHTKGAEDDLVALRGDGTLSGAGIPAVSVKRAVAEALFAESGISLEAAQKAIDEAKKPAPRALKSRADLVADVAPHKARTANVIGVLPGADPALNTEALVIGAHYDHLGMGGSGSLDAGASVVHPGADDNASGVAALLELARRLAPERAALKRSVLFIAFGAEEEGTLGSLHFTKEPTLPLEKIVAMLNLDMVGRLQNETLQVHGVGTSPAWKPLVASASVAAKLTVKPREQGYGPSDQSPFYAAGKPVLFFFTGTHSDYHRPSDTADKIDAAGEERVVRLVASVAEGILESDARPQFTPVAGDKKPFPDGPGAIRSWAGTIPDYSEDAGGLKLSGVWPGSPAEKAGLKRGDVIVRFAERPISNIYDYTYALQDHKAGERVTIIVKRSENGKTRDVTVELTLGTRPSGTH
jgi:aminopeptidase YwaD